MNPTKGDDGQQQRDTAASLGPLAYIAAAVLAVPVGAVAWFEIIYLWFGFTGEDPPPAVNLAAFLLAFAPAFGWPLYHSRRPAQVAQRSCQLGLLVSLLLPPVAFAVLALWQHAPGRRDLGMGGLMLYSFPIVALGVATVLAVVFGLGGRLARRRLQGKIDQ